MPKQNFEWVSVKERLPDTKKNSYVGVLVYPTRNNGICATYIVGWDKKLKKNDSNKTGKFLSRDNCEQIYPTHWAYYPKPPVK